MWELSALAVALNINWYLLIPLSSIQSISCCLWGSFNRRAYLPSVCPIYFRNLSNWQYCDDDLEVPYNEVVKTRQTVIEKPQVEEVNIKENFGDPAPEEAKVDEGHILNEYEGKDGKMYQEVEFADGSIQVREIKGEPVKSTTTTKSTKKTKSKKWI